MATKENTDYSYPNTEPKYMKIFGALDLITLGIVLLLNTTGVVSWKIWIELLRFWPLFIVSLGIGILFDFSNWSKVIGKILTYLLFVTMLFLAGVNTVTNSTVVDDFRKGLPSFLTGSWYIFNTNNNDLYKVTEYIASDYPEVKKLDLKMNNSKGTVSVSDVKSDNVLFSVSASYSNNDGEYTLDKTIIDDKMTLAFDSGKITNGFMFINNSAPKYEFLIGNYLQDSTLNLNLGAGDATLNLQKIALFSLKANTGAGKLTATFTDNALPETMDIEVGAGEMVVNIPRNAGYKLKYSVGIGGVRINGKDEVGGLGSKDTLVSDNYSIATRKVEITLNVGVGSFSLNY